MKQTLRSLWQSYSLNKNKIVRQIVVLLTILIAPIFAHATHIVGGTLTYVYNGGSSYTFTLKLYRDCSPTSAAFPNNVTINVRGYNGATFPTSRDFTMNLGTVTNIPSNLDTCAAPPTPMPCEQEGLYTITVNNLPPNPGGYHCYYQVCCRNLSTTNVNAVCNCIGATVATDIPGPSLVWLEDFTLANGTTTDAGTTAWTRSLGVPAPGYAQVQGNLFEVQGVNNAQATWLSQQITISTFASGVNLSVDLSENGNMDANDSIRTYYSINSGPFVQFAVNGARADDFTNAVASSGPLTGNTVQIMIRVHYDGSSPNSELYRWDNVLVYGNNFLSNSSPVFTAFPPLFLCQGNFFSFNHVAIDADGDSLAYSFYTPFNDAAPTYLNNVISFTPVTWLGGFSANNPLGGPPLTLNSATGVLTGTPTLTGQFIVGVLVREYRNGNFLNQVYRDVQFNVVFCPPPAQALIVPGDTINACSGLMVSFPNNSSFNSNNWFWNFGDGFTLADTSHLQFPSYSYPAPGTYLTTMITNKGTPCADTSYASVDVGFATANFSHNAPQCAGTNVAFTNLSTCSSNTTISGYSWNFGDSQTSTATSPTHAYTTGGTYNVTLITYTTLGCTDTLVLSVTITPRPAAPSPSNNSPLCAGSTLNLTTTAVVGATYSWTGPNSFTSSLQNPSIVGATLAAAGTYSLTITVAGCASLAGTTVVTINSRPTAPTASSNSPLCVGNTLNLTASTIVGATYSWTGPNSFTSSVQNPSIVSATAAASGTYSVTATVAGCTSVFGTTVVTVSPTPAAPTASSNSPICAGSTLNLNASLIAGATYSWTGPNSFTSSVQNPSIVSATTAASGTYSVTATVAGCTGPVGTVIVTVSNAPAAPTASSNSAICAGSTLNLTASTIIGATYSWTGPNSFTSSVQNPSIVNATVAASGTYSVTATVGGCTGAVGTVVVTVNPRPAAPTASSNSAICAGSTLNLTASTIIGATYSWTGPNSFMSSTQNPSIVAATTAASGTYTVTATVAGCTSLPGTTIVTVNPIPTPPTATSNSPLCAGSTLNLTATTIAGATYSWTGPNSFSSSLQNPNIVNATVAASGTYSVSVTVAGCVSSSPATTTVIVNPIPSAPTVSSNSPICAGSTLNLNASLIAGATYSWTGPNSFTSTLQNPSIVNATTAASGTYSVTATVAGCTSVAGTTVVTVNPIPSAPSASSNSPICVGNTLNLAATTIAGATYSWTGPNSFTSTLQNPSIVNATTAASGTYSVSVTVNGCTSVDSIEIVTVNATPVSPTASSNSPLCAGSTLNLTASTIIGATYSWTGPNSFTSTLQNPSISNVTVSASGTYTVVANNGCASLPATVTVVVNPTPAAPTLSSNSPVCIGSTLNLNASLIAGASYSWTGPNSFSSTTQNNTITGVTTAAAGTYTVNVTLNGCTSTNATITVVVSTPAVVSAGADATVCANNAAIVLAGSSSSGSGLWTSSGTGTFTPNASTLGATYTPSNADTAVGTVTLTLTSTNNGGCAAVIDQMIITITNAPTVDAGSNVSVCANNATVSLNGIVTVATGGVWTSNGTGTFSPNANTLNANYQPSAADTAAGFVMLYLSSTGNGTCLAAIDSISITITNAPTVNAGNSIFRCSNNPNANISGTTSTGTGTWTSNGTGTFTPNPNSLNATYIPTVADIAAGSVIITLSSTGNGNCLAVQDTLVITYTPPPTVTAGPAQTVCANNAAVVLSGISSTGTGTWTTSGSGTFSPNANTLNATYLPSAADTAAGTVTLTLTTTNNGGCIAVTDQLVITITDAPVANAGPDQSVCGNNAATSLTGTFTLATGIQWSSSGTGTFSPNTTTPNATYQPSAGDTTLGTIFLVLTTTGNGFCNPVSDTMILTITNAPNVNAGSNIISCINNPNTVLNANSSTGSGTWITLGSGTFSPNANVLNPTYIPSTADTTAGSVLLIFTSSNNASCSSVADTMLIVFAPVPTVTVSSGQTVCANNAIVSVSGTSSTGVGNWTSSGTGTFTPSANVPNPTYSPSPADTAAGSVILTYHAGNACTPVSASLIITITPAPFVLAGPDQSVCANNAVANFNAIIGGATNTGIWTTTGTGSITPSNTSLNITYTPSAADTISGTVLLILSSTGNGTCLAVSDTVVLTITQQPFANAGADLQACANNPAALNGIIIGGSGTGIWSTPNGTGLFNPSTTNLNASYTPSNADTLVGTIILVLTSTGNGGCIAASDTVLVNVIPGPIVSAGSDQTVCANNANVNLTGSVSVATGGIWTSTGTGVFSPADTVLNAVYIPDTTDINNGSVTLLLNSTGNGLCQSVSDSMTIIFSPAPLVNAGNPIAICNNVTSAILTGTISGGASTGQWTTSGSGTFTPNDTTLNAVYNLSPADTLAGSVVVYLTSTNNGTCFAVIDSVIITITPASFAMAGNDTLVCANVGAINLNGFVLGSGTGYWTSNGTGTFSPDSSALNASYIPSSADTAAGFVTLILSATNSCQASSDTVVLSFDPAPYIGAGTDITICGGGSVNLNGMIGNATNPGWTSNGDGQFTPSANVLNPVYTPGVNDTAVGTVILILSASGNGICGPVQDSLRITIGHKPDAAFVAPNSCLNTAVLFTDVSSVFSDSIVDWNWSSGIMTDTLQNGTFSFSTTGTQTVTLVVTTSAGCSDTITQTVYVNPVPLSDFGSVITCPVDAAFTDSSLIVSGIISSWSWNFGDSTSSIIQSPSHTYNDTGLYVVTLTVVSDSGCTSSYRDTLILVPCSDEINPPAVPGAFTPNGDGTNDMLYVRGGPFTEFDFRIYNEWGNLIFSSQSQSIGWDGTFKSKPQPEGGYVWVLNGVTADNQEVKAVGGITLIR
jgi:gliding motility-associated-like protein